MNKVLTTRQVADRLGMHLNTTYRYISKGLLPAYKLGGDGQSKRHWKVRSKDLEAFMLGAGQAHAEASNKSSQEQVAGPAPIGKERSQ